MNGLATFASKCWGLAHRIVDLKWKLLRSRMRWKIGQHWTELLLREELSFKQRSYASYDQYVEHQRFKLEWLRRKRTDRFPMARRADLLWADRLKAG